MRLTISGEWARRLAKALAAAKKSDQVLVSLHRSGEREERIIVERIGADGSVQRTIVHERSNDG